MIPFGHLGYVALLEIEDDHPVPVPAIRHQRKEDHGASRTTRPGGGGCATSWSRAASHKVIRAAAPGISPAQGKDQRGEGGGMNTGIAAYHQRRHFGPQTGHPVVSAQLAPDHRRKV